MTALAAVALAVAVAGRGCAADDDTPVGAVRALDEAARAGNPQSVFDLLGPKTQAILEKRASRASELGEHRYTPLDMVGLGAGDQTARSTFELERESDGIAIVNVISEGGQRSQITVVRVDGSWRVELLPE